MRGRKTGGRKRGIPNRKTLQRRIQAEAGVRAALESGVSPLEVILQVMRLGEASGITPLQMQAAQSALPYCHPRLVTTSVTHTGAVAVLGSPEERLAWLERGPQVEGEAEEVEEDPAPVPSSTG